MAVFPLPTTVAHPSASASTADVEAWTEQTVQAMGDLDVSAEMVPSTNSVPLDIPLDRPVRAETGDAKPRTVRSGYTRHEALQRDTLGRRESMLKGKEGTRRRQRWENDRLLNNPYVQPPLPVDWEVRPTHPVHSVPYFLAPLWDAELKARSAARMAARKSKAKSATTTEGAIDGAGPVPKELREKLKRSRAAKGLLQDLEEEVRGFVEQWEAQEAQKKKANMMADPDSEDEEIVFVGRDGRMNDVPSSPTYDAEEELERCKLVFNSLADDHGASFARWLVHSLGDYYGLRTWSVTVGNPARREAYVGIHDIDMKSGRRPTSRRPLPQPLWGMV